MNQDWVKAIKQHLSRKEEAFYDQVFDAVKSSTEDRTSRTPFSEYVKTIYQVRGLGDKKDSKKFILSYSDNGKLKRDEFYVFMRLIALKIQKKHIDQENVLNSFHPSWIVSDQPQGVAAEDPMMNDKTNYGNNDNKTRSLYQTQTPIIPAINEADTRIYLEQIRPLEAHGMKNMYRAGVIHELLQIDRNLTDGIIKLCTGADQITKAAPGLFSEAECIVAYHIATFCKYSMKTNEVLPDSLPSDFQGFIYQYTTKLIQQAQAQIPHQYAQHTFGNTNPNVYQQPGYQYQAPYQGYQPQQPSIPSMMPGYQQQRPSSIDTAFANYQKPNDLYSQGFTGAPTQANFTQIAHQNFQPTSAQTPNRATQVQQPPSNAFSGQSNPVASAVSSTFSTEEIMAFASKLDQISSQLANESQHFSDEMTAYSREEEQLEKEIEQQQAKLKAQISQLLRSSEEANRIVAEASLVNAGTFEPLIKNLNRSILEAQAKAKEISERAIQTNASNPFSKSPAHPVVPGNTIPFQTSIDPFATQPFNPATVPVTSKTTKEDEEDDPFAE